MILEWTPFQGKCQQRYLVAWRLFTVSSSDQLTQYVVTPVRHHKVRYSLMGRGAVISEPSQCSSESSELSEALSSQQAVTYRGNLVIPQRLGGVLVDPGSWSCCVISFLTRSG
jgi:hypothetical protein